MGMRSALGHFKILPYNTCIRKIEVNYEAFSPLALSMSLMLSACGEEFLNEILGPDNPEGISSESNSNDGSSQFGSPSKTQFSVYLIGSDLEDGNQMPERGGAGTSDLNEMVVGYQALSAEEQANIDVFVGFGGANKAGWYGIKYADMDCIISDSADGEYGNDSCYLFSDESANMGDRNTLTAFMNAVNQRKGEAGKTLFTFWDHGSSFMGVGPDSNHLQDGILKMEDLTSSFESTSSTLILSASMPV